MKPSIYLETTIVSYLTARPSRDLITAAHQQITQEWWSGRRSQFDLFVSQLVVREAAAGDEEAARQRLGRLEGIPLLELRDEALALSRELLRSGALPEKAAADALHVASPRSTGWTIF